MENKIYLKFGKKEIILNDLNTNANTNTNTTIKDLFYNLLSKIMSLCLDFSSEVRHSALHVLY